MTPETNCPFYGRYMYRAPAYASTPFLLLNHRGNQCALIGERFTPCQMETAREPVDWRLCPLARELTVDAGSPQ